MLKQTFASQPFLYRLPWAGSGIYHPELTTPPRIYAEAHYAGSGALIFLNQEQLIDGYEVIYLWLTFNTIYYPGYEYVLCRFNASTGAFLNIITAGSTPSFEEFAQSRDGTVWQVPLPPNLNPFQAIKCTIDPVLGIIPDAVPSYDLTAIGAFNCFSIDSETGLALIGYNAPQLRVHQLSSGALLRTIMTPAAPIQIMPEDTDRCYVYCANGTVCLINYTLGTLLSVFRIQSGYDPALSLAVSWDRKYRRFLYWSDAGYPLAVDGQNTSVIRGYFPQPQAVALLAPIPLQAPRKYRTTKVLSRVYGDVGEPMGSTRVTFAASPAIATFSGFPIMTDSDGECVGLMTATDAGTATITATADVGDTGALVTPPVITPQAGTPNFIPATGTTFPTTQSVSIGTTTLGAAIYYTTDGSTPTSGSTLYTAPLTLSASTTLKAIAILAGYTDSNVATATYTLTSGSPVLPSAPTVGTLTAGDGVVSLTFTPGADGGAPILHFTVTLSTGQTNTGSASPITVNCPNGIAVTATVKETTSAGTSPASGTSNSVTPMAAVGGGTPFASSLRVILQGQIVPNSTGSTPPAPTNGNYQKLACAAVAGATQYKWYRSAANGADVLPTAYGTSTVNEFADMAATGCVSGTVGPSGGGLANYVANQYLYRVSAVVGGVESAKSNIQSYDHFKNGVLFWIGGNFNSGVSENNSCTIAPMSGSAKFIRITQTGSYGFWLPFSGNNYTEWNLYLAGVNYFDFWCRGSAGVNLGMTCLRSGDVNIYKSGGGNKSVDLSAYAAFVANTWIHYRIPIADILGDYSVSGAGPQVIQRAFYKCLFQDHHNSFGTWDFDNGVWTP